MRPTGISPKQIKAFQGEIWSYYAKNKRDFPWRHSAHYNDPYKILVSEVMLQQTQASRVVGKYEEFLKRFPTLAALNRASVAEVISTWRGLGYNRRAIALKQIAAICGERWNYRLPKFSIEELDALPHIGYATACSISAFAWNAPVSFIETNIRRVFIHYFCQGQKEVSDTDILELVKRTLPEKEEKNPNGTYREWYYALMDYGSMLKGIVENPNRKSAGYKRQSAFVGSNRQVRGAILAILTDPSNSTGCSKKVLLGRVRACVSLHTKAKNVRKKISVTQKDFDANLFTMVQEGFLHISEDLVSLAKG